MTNKICDISTPATFINLDTNEQFIYDNICCDTYTDYESIFIIPIIELGWIDNVHLLTDGHCIDAAHLRRGLRYGTQNEIYSFFLAVYTFPCKHESMEAHWSYCINGLEYVTDSIFFSVENFYDC